MKHEEKLIWFDLLRGIASVLVLIMHLRALIFIDFSGGMSELDSFFYFITGFGHQAVVVFFVLSGFFIIRSIHEAAEQKTFNALIYSKNRLIRLWIVLLPSLIFTFLVDKIGLHLFADSFTYSGQIATLPDISPMGRLGLPDFIGNLFFLQGILVETYGSNAALWSLSYEFWYYLIFPLLYFAFRSYYSTYIRILLVVLGALCLFLVGESIRLNFIIWLLGGAAYIVIRNDLFLRSRILLKSVAAASFFCIGLSLIRFNIYPVIFNDFSLGLLTALMLCPFSKLSMKNIRMRNTAKFLSNISYTVYLTHLSVAVFIVSFVLKQRQDANSKTYLLYFVVLTCVSVYSYLQYWLFERNTSSVKKILDKSF